jgi:hypothetical protein
MAHDKADKPISTEERKAIFLALVKSQDEGMSLVLSRRAIAKQFEINDRKLRRIEQEGIDGNWPPLE